MWPKTFNLGVVDWFFVCVEVRSEQKPVYEFSLELFILSYFVNENNYIVQICQEWRKNLPIYYYDFVLNYYNFKRYFNKNSIEMISSKHLI